MSDKMDILDRLIEQSDWYDDGHGPIHLEAAAEIERLRAEVARLQQSLDVITEEAAAIRARGTP